MPFGREAPASGSWRKASCIAVRPSFHVRVRLNQLSNLRLYALHPEELHIVTGVGFVDRGADGHRQLNPDKCSAVLIADQSGSGSVTLKKASLATFSYGPGVSIDAEVGARMNGGVSSRIGGTVEGIVTMLRLTMKSRRPPRESRKACRRPLAGGWSFSTCSRTCCGVRFASSLVAVARKASWLRRRSM